VNRVANRLGPRARAATLLALVGALGFLAGIGANRLLADPEPAGVQHVRDARPGARPGNATRPGPEGGMRRMQPPALRFSDHLAEELGLSAEQRAAIDSIMAENRTRVRALMREYQPRFREIVEETRRGVADVLTDEQRERMREMRSVRWREWVDSAAPAPRARRDRAARGDTAPGEPRP